MLELINQCENLRNLFLSISSQEDQQKCFSLLLIDVVFFLDHRKVSDADFCEGMAYYDGYKPTDAEQANITVAQQARDASKKLLQKIFGNAWNMFCASNELHYKIDQQVTLTVLDKIKQIRKDVRQLIHAFLDLEVDAQQNFLNAFSAPPGSANNIPAASISSLPRAGSPIVIPARVHDRCER